MKSFSLKSILPLAVVLGLAATPRRAAATPYASGVSNVAGTISFILNENADDVTVIFDNGSSTNDLGAKTKGTISFSLGASTNYQIVVRKKASAGYMQANGAAAVIQQISTDGTLNSFNAAKGVAINKNAKSPYFGRVYVANAAAGTSTGTGARTIGDGIYLLKADLSDAVGNGNTVATAGLAPIFAAGGTASSPWRLAVGPADDNLYICDWSDATGNLYVANPDVSGTTGTNVLKVLFNTTGTGAESGNVPVGVDNNHGSITAAWIEGSLVDGNLAVYTLDEDLQVNKTTTTRNQEQSLWRYNIGAGPLPFGSDPTKIYTPTSAEGITFTDGVIADFERGADGKYYYVTYRSAGTDTAGLIVRNSASSSTLFNSRVASIALVGGTADLLRQSQSVAVSPDQKFVAVLLDNTTSWILPLTNGVPDLTARLTLATFTATATTGGRSLRFDAAGNLYVAGTVAQRLRAFSPGGTSITTYTNDINGTNGSFSVVRIDPDIFTQPVNLTANAGATATFTVTATGSGTLKYQWTRSGTNIAGATAASYARANVQQPDAGMVYAVIITNLSGSVTSALTSLTVNDTAPVITVQPASRTNNAGTTATFSVTTTGTDPRYYQWQFNSVDIPGANASSYSLLGVLNSNQGPYTVWITNSLSTAPLTSSVANLTVIDPAVNTQPKSQTNGTGANVTFSVVAGGTGLLYYQWQTNSTPITDATNTSYTSTNIQIEQSGTAFSIIVSNSLNWVTSSVAVLTVTNKAPVIITQPAIQIVGVGDTASFSVAAQGQNPLTYQWGSNAVNLVEGGNVSGSTTPTVSLSNVQLTDAGFYSVLVANSGQGLSVSSASAQLVVTQAFTLGTGTGLNGDYWNLSITNAFTNAPTLTRIDTNVDFAWGVGSPDPLIPTNLFVARWCGQVQPLYSQTYSFYIFSDDGARLWVDGNLLVDKWVNQSPTEWSSNLVLNANQKYDIVMEYYENTGGADAHLRWSSASQLKGPIPTTQLYPALAPVKPKLNSSVADGNLLLNWMGTYTLQSSPDLTIPYTNVTGAVIAPYTNGPLSEPQQFLRLQAY